MTDQESSSAQPAGLPLSHVDALPAGTRLAEFEVQSLLGVGGFGMVYRAYDHSLHRTVAIKEYMPSALAGRQNNLAVSIRSSADQQTYFSGLNSFVAEARLLAQFDHPSLVKVHRFWVANNTAYMVMPLYSGITLKQARAQMASPPPEPWLRALLWSITQALKVLHDHQTLHRDVSPDNIFLQDMGPPVLLDLGAARHAISGQTQKHTAILKVNYAPIEQYAETDDLKPGAWSDLYSLAAVVHGCLCNESPTPATFRLVRDSMPSMASVVGTVQEQFGQSYSPEFASTVAHALAIQPAERPQSVPAFVDAMQLVPPAALAQFDWRAELGGILLPATGESSQSLWQTQQQTVVEQHQQWQVAAGQDVTARVDASQPDIDFSHAQMQAPAMAAPASVARAGRAMTSGRAKTWLAGATLGLAGLAYWGLQGSGIRAPVVAAPEPVASPPPAKAREPAGAAVQPAPSPKERGEPARPKETAVPRQAGNGPAVGKTAADKAALLAAATVPARPDRPHPAPAQTELCADSNFLTRPMCIHLECKKAEYAALAVCVEDRQRYPDN